MTSLTAAASSAPPGPTPKAPTPADQLHRGKSVPLLSTAFGRTVPSTAAAAAALMTVRIENDGTAALRKLTMGPSQTLGLPKARRHVPASRQVKFTVSTVRSERTCLRRSRLPMRRQVQEVCHDPPKAMVIDPDPTPPRPRRSGSQVRWADHARVVRVERTSREWLAQRAYILALHFAKDFRKKAVPDAFIDAFFELEELAVEAFDAAVHDRKTRCQIRNLVKILIHQRLSVYRVACNKEFLKALATMGRALLQLAEDAERLGCTRAPNRAEAHREHAAIKTPPSSPQYASVVSPTRLRGFVPSCFAKASVDRTAPNVEACLQDDGDGDVVVECDVSGLDATVMAVVGLTSP